ncbi:hypothetical protein Cob_v006379 [Colletotrichum orbiculare MAFF 240422]|uniref:Uncharacterized protein n=1 Tax=Colletotrichum orbiculare (strain 104-T / ATCC 96160 / CBS 514.97 / LARS 414 / MAFF 240422) TaxID=1213857 RepID=A0A484FPY7_COLOR|nr:hypothetical protein Cob_v006379 [Colletotrichum orbiculare MAFF 240422]
MFVAGIHADGGTSRAGGKSRKHQTPEASRTLADPKPRGPLRPAERLLCLRPKQPAATDLPYCARSNQRNLQTQWLALQH